MQQPPPAESFLEEWEQQEDLVARATPRESVQEKLSYVAWLLGPFALIVLLWEVVARVGAFAVYILPPPSTVAVTFWTYIGNGQIFVHIRESAIRLLFGFMAGAGIGVPLGIAMGMNRNIGRFFDPLVNLGQAIPGLAWIPLAILWFGLGYKAVTFIIFTSVFFPVLFSTLTGVRGVPQTLINAALTMGLLWVTMDRLILKPLEGRTIQRWGMMRQE